jgi:hypothetical protein
VIVEHCRKHICVTGEPLFFSDTEPTALVEETLLAEDSQGALDEESSAK